MDPKEIEVPQLIYKAHATSWTSLMIVVIIAIILVMLILSLIRSLISTVTNIIKKKHQTIEEYEKC